MAERLKSLQMRLLGGRGWKQWSGLVALLEGVGWLVLLPGALLGQGCWQVPPDASAALLSLLPVHTYLSNNNIFIMNIMQHDVC